ncbi:hypothetical protein LZ30DRAFT_52212 [Colletotrichum cereale]|nr:hypothetical protein LZ30DRAFT_52212 [Colletotrichum cereale]
MPCMLLRGPPRDPPPPPPPRAATTTGSADDKKRTTQGSSPHPRASLKETQKGGGENRECPLHTRREKMKRSKKGQASSTTKREIRGSKGPPVEAGPPHRSLIPTHPVPFLCCLFPHRWSFPPPNPLSLNRVLSAEYQTSIGARVQTPHGARPLLGQPNRVLPSCRTRRGENEFVQRGRC